MCMAGCSRIMAMGEQARYCNNENIILILFLLQERRKE